MPAFILGHIVMNLIFDLFMPAFILGKIKQDWVYNRLHMLISLQINFCWEFMPLLHESWLATLFPFFHVAHIFQPIAQFLPFPLFAIFSLDSRKRVKKDFNYNSYLFSSQCLDCPLVRRPKKIKSREIFQKDQFYE